MLHDVPKGHEGLFYKIMAWGTCRLPSIYKLLFKIMDSGFLEK
jgi:hypothetical protein